MLSSPTPAVPANEPDRLGPGKLKARLDDLAVLGGPQLFDAPLHVGRPNIGDRERLFARLDAALDRRQLTNGGPLVVEFEERVAALVGVRHAIAVTNAMLGLQIAARATRMAGEVIVPSFTFIATAHALDWTGLTPVFADIEAERLNLDPGAIEPLVGERTTGIVATHLWGRTCDTDELAGLAERHGLRLIYDAAHAFACSRDGRMVGAFGDAEVFSFHATKFVNAFEGGMITTDDDAIAEDARLLRNFGFVGIDRTVSTGTNGKMSEASAAMGLTSLDAIDMFVAVNHRNERLYHEHLDGVDGLSMLPPDDRGECNGQHVVLRIEPGSSGRGRDVLYRALRAENVLARRYFYPGCHRMEPYLGRASGGGPHLPHTERATSQTLVLPTGTGITEEEIVALCALIRFVVSNAEALAPRIAS
ncbi:aminotransferase class I/II-fold pyridoxal phosphate-dependent enzyme [soil metagenome]